MSYKVAIKSIDKITHDVKQFTFEKPKDFSFTPGQATEVAVNKEGWEDEKRPFTFTSLETDPHLQFTIKIYKDHEGVTDQINKLEVGEEFLLDNPWGTIEYKGPGVFLAGGAGVTPFIAILRQLHKERELEGNKLIFSNKTAKDVILRSDFERMLGENFISVLTDEDAKGNIFLDGFIDKAFLKDQIDNFDQPFYVCGPPKFNENIMKYLKDLGAEPDSLVFEE